jgi:hypothetical protein
VATTGGDNHMVGAQQGCIDDDSCDAAIESCVVAVASGFLEAVGRQNGVTQDLYDLARGFIHHKAPAPLELVHADGG